MADYRRIKFVLLCILCAALGFYSARQVFDYIAGTQSMEAAGSRPRVVPASLVSASVSPVVPPPTPALPAADRPKKKQSPQDIKETTRPVLALNGIMLSAGTNYVLINNKVVKEGDKIEGITVVHIAKDSVELKDGDAAFKIYPNAKSY